MPPIPQCHRTRARPCAAPPHCGRTPGPVRRPQHSVTILNLSGRLRREHRLGPGRQARCARALAARATCIAGGEWRCRVMLTLPWLCHVDAPVAANTVNTADPDFNCVPSLPTQQILISNPILDLKSGSAAPRGRGAPRASPKVFSTVRCPL